MIDENDDNKGFISGITFNHIYDLYKLDDDIRNAIRHSMENFENTFKQALADIISDDISTDDDIYTSKNNYHRGKFKKCIKVGNKNHRKQKRIYDIDNLIYYGFDYIKNLDKHPYKYYRENHGNIPPWIMVKGLTLGSTKYWYSLSNKYIKEKVISKMLGFDITNPICKYDEDDIIKAFNDILDLYLSYRNLSSHGGRSFSYRSRKHKIRNYSKLIYQNDKLIKVSKRQFKKGKLRSSVGAVINTLELFDNDEPLFSLMAEITILSTKYLESYPEDLEYLLKKMELEGTRIDRDLCTGRYQEPHIFNFLMK